MAWRRPRPCQWHIPQPSQEIGHFNGKKMEKVEQVDLGLHGATMGYPIFRHFWMPWLCFDQLPAASIYQLRPSGRAAIKCYQVPKHFRPVMSELQTHPKSAFQNVQPIHKTQSIDLHCHLNSTKHLPSCRRARSAKDVGRHPWAWDHRPPARQTGRSPPRRALRWPMKGEKWDR